MAGDKLIFEKGRFLWEAPDGSKRPLTHAEHMRVRMKLGQVNSVKQRRKNHE